MVTEKILDFLFAIVMKLLSWLPEVSWTFTTGNIPAFFQFVNMVCYLLPVQTISAIAVLIFDIALFRAFVSLVRTCKDLIPFI